MSANEPVVLVDTELPPDDNALNDDPVLPPYSNDSLNPFRAGTSYDTPPPEPEVLPEYQSQTRRLVPAASQKLKFSFERVDPLRWLVRDDDDGSVLYEVIHVRATPEHTAEETAVKDGIEGPILLTVYGDTMSLGSFITEYKRTPRHAGKFSFLDQNRREFAFREEDRDRLIIYPSKRVVAEGNVTFVKGSGKLKILDKENCPEIPMLIGAYTDLIRRQAEVLAWRQSTTLNKLVPTPNISPDSQAHWSSRGRYSFGRFTSRSSVEA